MSYRTNRAFTLVEIMIVVMVIGILATALFSNVKPYLMRSRDTKRITDMQNYVNNVIGSYDKTYDTFPSNYGSGGNSMTLGYCLSEVAIRSDILSPGGLGGRDGYFTTLSKESSTPPIDQNKQVVYMPLCSIPGSYIYSRMKYGNGSEIAVIAGKLELRTSANYGTGSDLTDSGKVQDIISAKKSSIPTTATEQLYTVFTLH